MKKQELAPGIVVYQNVIDKPKSLILDIEDAVKFNVVNWREALVKEENFDGVNKKTRDTYSIGVPYLGNSTHDLSSPLSSFNSTLGQIFFDSFDPLEKNYMSLYNINMISHDQYGILKYGIGQKFINHIDDHPDYPRRVSTVYYMNDDYSGGEIEFPRFKVSYKPKANELLIFPSTYVYNHSVKEVKSGTRYAVVSWMK